MLLDNKVTQVIEKEQFLMKSIYEQNMSCNKVDLRAYDKFSFYNQKAKKLIQKHTLMF